MKAEIANYLQGLPMPPKREASNLRYCLECKTVWEKSWYMGRGMQCIKHSDMPSYKLNREFCFDCKEADTTQKGVKWQQQVKEQEIA